MRLAKFVSYIAHPIFITTYMMAFALFQKNSYLYYTITATGRWFFLGVTAILTILAPLFSVGYLLYTKQLSSIEMKDRKERILPMAITVAYTFGLYYLFSTFSMPSVIMAIIGVGVVATVMTLFITFFWKISTHLVAFSGLTAMVIVLSAKIHPVPNAVIIGLFFFTGIIGWARLRQNAHSLSQVLVGWATGFSISYFAMLFLLSS